MSPNMPPDMPPHDEMAEPHEAEDMAAATPDTTVGGKLPPPPTPIEVIPVGDMEVLVQNLNDAGAFLAADHWFPLPKPVPEDAKRGVGGTRKPMDPITWMGLNLVAGITAAVAQKVPALQSMVFDPAAIASGDGVKDVANKLAQVSQVEEAQKVAADLIASEMAKGSPEGGQAPGAPPPAGEPPVPPPAA